MTFFDPCLSVSLFRFEELLNVDVHCDFIFFFVQVVDIQSDGGPQRALSLFKSLAVLDRLRVLVCGGDGTAGWVIEEIRRLYGPPTECHVPVGILPLVSNSMVMFIFLGV